MSFLDLETIAMHRRNELDARISNLMTKCDKAQWNVKKLQTEAQKLVQHLNCEPTQLKEQFLNSMKQLDEYIYLITDFNLSVEKILETAAKPEAVPVQDPVKLQTMLVPTKLHLLDILSEPLPSTSSPKVDNQKLRPVANTPKKKRHPKEDSLIEFSSTSCSQESVTSRTQKKETQKAPTVEFPAGDMCILTPKEPNSTLKHWNLSAQTVLETDTIYEGYIIHVDDTGASLWIITDSLDMIAKQTQEMAIYYNDNMNIMSEEQFNAMTYCALYDEAFDGWYRCLVLKLDQDPKNNEPLELFLVDIGEVKRAPLSHVQPLARQFCELPPVARACHLAGVDMTKNCSEEMMAKRESTLKKFIATMVKIEVEDNTSECLEVSILLPTGQLLGDLLIDEGLADEDKSYRTMEAAALPPAMGPPEMSQINEDLNNLDITDGPEYEDPLEAVTGYHNRDEIDICKHYKGPPNKTCFKGDRCNKRHVVKHPDGWTLDRVEVPAKGGPLPLPAPATWHRVHVSHVGNFDLVFVQYAAQNAEEQRRTFGQVLPPMTLADLVRDMNSPAGRAALKPLQLAPAPGELVAALYPPDGQWYRAMVLSLTNHDQSIEVTYVDFGNDIWVKENNVRQLEPEHTLLPHQAVRCRLAGVAPRCDDLQLWVRAKQRLQRLTENCMLQMHVISRSYDEVEVELYNTEGSVAEQLEREKLVTLEEFTVQDDTQLPQRVVVP